MRVHGRNIFLIRWGFHGIASLSLGRARTTQLIVDGKSNKNALGVKSRDPIWVIYIYIYHPT